MSKLNPQQFGIVTGEYPEAGTSGLVNSTLRDVPVERLRTDQQKLRRKVVDRYVQQPSDEPVVVHEHPGPEYWLADGNHRAAAAAVRGDATVRAEVWHR